MGLRGFFDWMSPGEPPRPPEAPTAPATALPDVGPRRIGHYQVVRKLGEGGMGVVYLARDERLDREVALKVMSAVARDPTSRERFWREARAAASVNHPNVCQLHEIGEHGDELFLVMELLEGQSLAERLRKDALGVGPALGIAQGVLSALHALHARGIVHRDLKPSNVFLTPHGVKILDFGLACSDAELEKSISSLAPLTATGVVMGTPRYMAPEQVTGDAVGPRADLFAAGAILFEMLAGRPAFEGRSIGEVLHATLHEQPPALSGSPEVAAVDRVIRRALSKRADDRYASAEEMAAELRAVGPREGTGVTVHARTLTRLVVLPFRVLRPDPETDFLAFSLPDAISTSLSGRGPLVVRSSAGAARFAGEAPDLRSLASEIDVDRVVFGTLLRAGDQIRVTAQLVEAPGGTLVTSHTVQAPLGDLFGLQDDIARRVVDALALPLGGAPVPQAPRDGGAYELYLRANELARTHDQLPEARALYERSVELDPTFAPAWARLARCRRFLGKYVEDSAEVTQRAEEALRRALELDPGLSLAHKVYAQIEADRGQAVQAMVRLLHEVRRHGNDAELFAGLVHACRYCGLLEESVAADREARRLDPTILTSVGQTHVLQGDYAALHSTGRPQGVDRIARAVSLGLMGRRDESKGLLATVGPDAPAPLRGWARFVLAWLEGRTADMLEARGALRELQMLADPEPIFRQAMMLCDAGEHAAGLDNVRRAVAGGYFVASSLATLPLFDALRSSPAFQDVLREAEAGRGRAREAFREGGGARLLGLPG
jgi:serine/threonine protein kinase/tetratricopeptide (TPR) repeat protein